MVSGDSGAASFFIAISRAVVNQDDGDGTARDPLVWSAGALPKRRRVGREEHGRAMLAWPFSLWMSDWVNLLSAMVTAGDVGAWPCSVGLLVKWVTFRGTLHWLAAGADLGGGGVSFVEMLILCELSAVPLGPGIDIWRPCWFIGALIRSLCALPGGVGGFMPCSVGANH